MKQKWRREEVVNGRESIGGDLNVGHQIGRN